MSWWHTSTLRLRSAERSVAGRVVFVVNVSPGTYANQENQEQVDRKSSSVQGATARSYSEFRSLWRSLLRATSSTTLFEEDTRRTSVYDRLSRTSESWVAISRRVLGTIDKPGMFSSGRCHCSQDQCPFDRLHVVLKDYPFPRKKLLLTQLDEYALERRRQELERFLLTIQTYFRGFALAFLDQVDSCEVLHLLNAFLGIDEGARTSVIASPGANVTDSNRLSTPRGSLAPDSTRNARHLPQLQIKTIDVDTSRASWAGRFSTVFDVIGSRVMGSMSSGGDVALALYTASTRGHCGTVVELLDRGADPNAVIGDLSSTALHAASHNGRLKVVQVLLAFGASMNEADARGMTPLMSAVGNGQVQVAQFLMRAGADLSRCNTQGESALHDAVRNGSVRMIRLLLDQGADVNVQNARTGQTPLHIAAVTGNLAKCRLLLGYKADTELCTLRGRKPINLAIEGRHKSVIQLLEQHEDPEYTLHYLHDERQTQMMESSVDPEDIVYDMTPPQDIELVQEEDGATYAVL
ncbi:hypothetical protein Poli38472_005851 [Pythium oligandrum]|uniref:Uncharacterized protein n=1 Tax=Pythium oligandrum TaxID=41045 RepID=A0A8K1FSB1_PYTOL|nr:hypothetical protein Poli38472_005851 [Pythium oligandrum]|eukprot:TMW68383.1 hypothetical protein Poli38472_005851 [Pythium oligandrum]